MKKHLVKLADHLDKKGLYKEANYLDNILKKAYEDENNSYQGPEEDKKAYVIFLESDCEYFRGIFESYEKAEEAKKQLRSRFNSSYSIEEIILNKIYED